MAVLIQSNCEVVAAADVSAIDASTFTVTAKVLAALVPQEFVAVTLILPFWPIAPEVAVIETVPCPAVIFQPVGTVHV